MREALLQELCQVAVTAARSAGEIIQTHVNLVLSLKTKSVKDLVNLHQSHGILNTYTPKNFNEWWAKHDTAPTECALLPFDQVVLAAQSSRFSFNELNIQSDIYHGL